VRRRKRLSSLAWIAPTKNGAKTAKRIATTQSGGSATAKRIDYAIAPPPQCMRTL
jgi:hypothetical protein